MIVGKGGCFEVIVDGKVVFSKSDAGRFPNDSEVINAIGKLSDIV